MKHNNKSEGREERVSRMELSGSSERAVHALSTAVSPTAVGKHLANEPADS
ncbi:MAG: hypothetical protein V2G42_06865 [bacterium JZ-2024 1]